MIKKSWILLSCMVLVSIASPCFPLDHKINGAPGGHTQGSHGDGHGSSHDRIDQLEDGRFLVDPDSGIAPVTVTFKTFVPVGIEPFSYAYDFGDGTQPQNSTRQVDHTYQDRGDYTATVTVTDATGAAMELTVFVSVLNSQDIADLQSDLREDADQSEVITDPAGMGAILSDAREVIDRSLRAVAAADAAVRDAVESAVQKDTGDLIANTRDKLAGWVQNDQIQEGEVESIFKGIGDVVSNMVRNDLPVSEQSLADMEAISASIFDFRADDLLAKENLTQAQIDEIKSDSGKAGDYLKSKPHLLDEVVKQTGIQVDVNTPFDTDDVDTLAAGYGLTAQQTGLLINSVESTQNVFQTIALSTVSQQTIAQIAESVFNTYSQGKKVIQSFSDPIARNILLAFDDGSYLAFLVKGIAVVDDHMPPGLFDLPDGTRLGIINSYAVNYVAYPVYPLGFTAELVKAGAKSFLGQNGMLNVVAAPMAYLATRVGWQLYPANTFNAMTLSFSVTGGTDPSAEAYSMLVTYDTGGASQLLPPTVGALDALTTAFDALFPGTYSINNDTGVITVGTLKLKPDYLFSALPDIDYTAITAAGGIVYNSIAFAIEDYNNDGVMDFGFYSDDPMGFQILYTL